MCSSLTRYIGWGGLNVFFPSPVYVNINQHGLQVLHRLRDCTIAFFCECSGLQQQQHTNDDNNKTVTKGTMMDELHHPLSAQIYPPLFTPFLLLRNYIAFD